MKKYNTALTVYRTNGTCAMKYEQHEVPSAHPHANVVSFPYGRQTAIDRYQYHPERDTVMWNIRNTTCAGAKYWDICNRDKVIIAAMCAVTILGFVAMAFSGLAG